MSTREKLAADALDLVKSLIEDGEVFQWNPTEIAALNFAVEVFQDIVNTPPVST